MGPFKAVHVDDIKSHSNVGDSLEGSQEVAQKKKVGPGGSGKGTDPILKEDLTMEITGSAVEG